MRVHAVWDGHREPIGSARFLDGIEWLFLLFGLVALDAYIWINTSSIVYEAYQDWAFDQDLRGLAAAPLTFAGDEIRSLLGRERLEATQLPSLPPALLPDTKLLDTVPPTASAVIGRLEIPNLHLVAVIREGADSGTLRRAVGHIPGTALPGRQGNVALAGHRDTFFRPLRGIQVNDLIELETTTGMYQYQVQSMRVVGPRDVQVLASSPEASLTLVTCFPFYYVGSAPKRFVVRASLVSAGSPTAAIDPR